MTDRIDLLEQKVERIVIILEGEPVHDLDNNIIGREGGMVELGQRSAEQLLVIERQLGRIETGVNGHKPVWTRTQKIGATGIGATLLVGILSSAWSTIRIVATWIGQI
ncbi:hypothetical protein LCGC14_1052920 [marine sediment metagenome]|uniref:Uncharacterized protein n=1 Tax=marine sediment metagenome TaxID=412755 RepID=A0A0F9QUF2_9ZZZZ